MVEIYMVREIKDDAGNPTGRYRRTVHSDEDPERLCFPLCQCKDGHATADEARDCPHAQRDIDEHSPGIGDLAGELAELIEWVDAHLDSNVSDAYKQHPLAQDWARVAKASEEAGEAIDALIGMTGQNPRKGVYSTLECLTDELADVALTGLYAIQHFTKDRDRTMRILLHRARHHRERIEGASSSASA